RDDYGNTALMYAAGMGLGDLVKTLLEKGADKNIKRKDGRTALDIAKAKGYTYIANS
ncbi:MAG TPA: ankyrin repeat domain-containing protein, partial [bacterium]|nr:ankyrin repeat domain-containing protein [bacterium]